MNINLITGLLNKEAKDLKFKTALGDMDYESNGAPKNGAPELFDLAMVYAMNFGMDKLKEFEGIERFVKPESNDKLSKIVSIDELLVGGTTIQVNHTTWVVANARYTMTYRFGGQVILTDLEEMWTVHLRTPYLQIHKNLADHIAESSTDFTVGDTVIHSFPQEIPVPKYVIIKNGIPYGGMDLISLSQSMTDVFGNSFVDMNLAKLCAPVNAVTATMIKDSVDSEQNPKTNTINKESSTEENDNVTEQNSTDMSGVGAVGSEEKEEIEKDEIDSNEEFILNEYKATTRLNVQMTLEEFKRKMPNHTKNGKFDRTSLINEYFTEIIREINEEECEEVNENGFEMSFDEFIKEKDEYTLQHEWNLVEFMLYLERRAKVRAEKDKKAKTPSIAPENPTEPTSNQPADPNLNPDGTLKSLWDDNGNIIDIAKYTDNYVEDFAPQSNDTVNPAPFNPLGVQPTQHENSNPLGVPSGGTLPWGGDAGWTGVDSTNENPIPGWGTTGEAGEYSSEDYVPMSSLPKFEL